MDAVVKLPKRYWIYLIGMAALSLAIQVLPFNRVLSILLQIAVVGITFAAYIEHPVVSIATILFLNVVPSLSFYAVNSEYQSYYQLNSLMVMILCLAPAVYKYLQSNGRIAKNRIYLLSALLAVFMLVSAVGTESKLYYTSDFYVLPILYLSLPYFFESRKDIYFSWLSFAVSGMVFVVSLFVKTVTVGTIYDVDALIDRNYLALFTVISLITIITSLFQREFFRSKLYALAAVAVCALAIYLLFTYASRTAFFLVVIFAFALTCYFFFRNIKAVLLIVFLAAIALYWISSTDIAEFLFERLERDDMSNANGRLDIALEYLSAYSQSGIFQKIMGRGYKVFRAVFNGVPLYAHNSFLAVLMDFGLVSFVLYVAMLIRTGIRLWRSEYRIFFFSFAVIVAYMFALEVHQDIAGICYLMTFVGMADVIGKAKQSEKSGA